MRPPARHLMAIVWPAFLMAGVVEALVFSVVDPQTLHWWGGSPIDWPEQAIYTVAFFVFWGAMVIAGLLTRLLTGEASDINREGFSGAFRH